MRSNRPGIAGLPTNYEIGDPVEFVVSEAVRIQNFYPRLMVVPLLYTVEDDRLMQITSSKLSDLTVASNP